MRAGDQGAFNEFFQSNVPRLLAFATRYSKMDSASAEDVVQNALIKAMRNLSSYRGEASLFTWLTQICLYEMVDNTRKAARRPLHMSLHDLDDLWHLWSELHVPPNKEPAAEVETELRRTAILQTLQSLPRRYAQVLEAKYGDGLSVEEIATMLGVTPVAVQSLLARAREAFRTSWSGADQHD
jgi:RNA polymerase sigma-70 factor, ECF subfamily